MVFLRNISGDTLHKGDTEDADDDDDDDNDNDDNNNNNKGDEVRGAIFIVTRTDQKRLLF
jgi:hypothetical protein